MLPARIFRAGAGPSRGVTGLRRLRLDLLNAARRRAVDRDAARLHRLRDFPEQFDPQQAILERRALHLHMVGKAELALEGARGDALIEIFALALVGLAAFDRHRVLLG